MSASGARKKGRMSSFLNRISDCPQVEKTVKSIKEILYHSRNPTFAANDPHRYEVKFALIEQLVDTALSSQLESIKQLGLLSKSFEQLFNLSQNRSLILRSSSIERCTFLREESREEVTHVLQKDFTTKKKIRIIKTFFWNFTLSSFLQVCVKGGGEEDCETIFAPSAVSHSKTLILESVANQSPQAEYFKPIPSDLDITWLLRQWNHQTSAVSGLTSIPFTSFRINRTAATCFTPVRNSEVLAALNYFDSVIIWAAGIESYSRDFRTRIGDRVHNDRLEALLDSFARDLFVPVMPISVSDTIADEATSTNTASAMNGEGFPSVLLTSEEIDLWLEKERWNLEQALWSLGVFMADREFVLSVGHMEHLLILRHLSTVSRSLVRSVMSIETMLERQLLSAIGREVAVEDVREYLKLRGQQLFRTGFQPLPMVYAVRRSSSHAPEGTVSLSLSSTTSPTVHTVVRREVMKKDSEIPSQSQTNSTRSMREERGKSVGPMSFSLSDSTRVTITGERFVHSYLHPQFGTSQSSPLLLSLHARQFSSFIVLLGTISSSSSFEPTHAIIVRNNDELTIPLEMEFIPSLKEFQRAISSLSPQQQQFAEAIREFQLSNTLFGITVIQIKPQLERVLNLPPGSLTKEIKLMEDLWRLFVEHQIPSDLLSYNELLDEIGEEERALRGADSSRAIEQVRENVKAIQVQEFLFPRLTVLEDSNRTN
jgi:hypothetical protein